MRVPADAELAKGSESDHAGIHAGHLRGAMKSTTGFNVHSSWRHLGAFALVVAGGRLVTHTADAESIQVGFIGGTIGVVDLASILLEAVPGSPADPSSVNDGLVGSGNFPGQTTGLERLGVTPNQHPTSTFDDGQGFFDLRVLQQDSLCVGA